MIEPIVDTAWVKNRPEQLVLADVRWYLDGRPARPAFEAGHIPGAVFIELDRALAAHDQPASAGRHPLPSPERFATAMEAAGIGATSVVVAYDDSGGGTAGRLVFMLRVLGVDAALLDGGLAAWDGPLATGPGSPPATASFPVVAWPTDRFASVDEVEAAGLAARSGDPTAPLVLDARAAERHSGEIEPIDRRAGHIPGAKSAPWAANLGTDGRFGSAEELRARFAVLGAAGDREVVCYCGSGVSACADLLALERAGLTRTRLYVASWSGWSSDPDRAVATGAE